MTKTISEQEYRDLCAEAVAAAQPSHNDGPESALWFSIYKTVSGYFGLPADVMSHLSEANAPDIEHYKPNLENLLADRRATPFSILEIAKEFVLRRIGESNNGLVRIFAYGSNMDFAQMRERCPSALFRCVAKLNDYRLAFTRRSTRRNCGVAGVVRDDGNAVWGVVYEIDEGDLLNLDRLEGVNSGAYVRRDHQLLNTLDNQAIYASIYFAAPQQVQPPPNEEYKNLILNGATHWQLPPDYIEQLEGIETEDSA